MVEKRPNSLPQAFPITFSDCQLRQLKEPRPWRLIVTAQKSFYQGLHASAEKSFTDFAQTVALN